MYLPYSISILLGRITEMIQLAWGLGKLIKVVDNKEKLVYYFGTEHKNVQFKIPKRFFKYFRWDTII